MSIKSKSLLLSIVSLFISLLSFAQISIQTKTNGTKIGTEDILEITYIFNAPRGGVEVKLPNFSGFRMVMNNKVIINNQYEYTYHLQPINPGDYTISGITLIDSEGNISKSNPIKIKVVNGKVLRNTQPKSSSSTNNSAIDQLEKIRQQLFQDPFINQQLGKVEDHFFIVPETKKSTYYLGEPIYVTYKLYNNTGFSGLNIVSLPNTPDFISKNFDFNERPVEKVENYGNVPFRTFELKKSILYGYKTGTFEIDGPVVSAYVDFFGIAESSVKKKKVTIISLPSVPANKTFQGGVGTFSLSSQFSQIHSTTDDPISFTIQITGDGNIESVSLPDIKWPEGITVSEPEMNTYTNEKNPRISTKTYTFYIYSSKDTSVTIPSIEWTYFDTDDKTYKTLSTGEQQLTFFPGTSHNDTTSSLENYENISSSENKNSSIVLYSLIGFGVAMAGFFGFLFYKKEKKKYDKKSNEIISDQEQVSSESTLLPENPTIPTSSEIQLHQNKNNESSTIESLRPYRFDKFDLDGIIHESNYRKISDFYSFSHQYIIQFLQNSGVRANTNETILAELKSNNVQEEIIISLEEIFKCIHTRYYNPLPAEDWEKDSLLEKIKNFHSLISN